MANINASQVARVATLLAQGKSIEEIAATIGLDIGDVQSIMSGSTRTYVETLESGQETVTSPVVPTVTHFAFPAETDLASTAPGQFAVIDEAADLMTIPKGGFFNIALKAELSVPADPGGAAPMAWVALDAAATPDSGAWDDDAVWFGALLGANYGPDNLWLDIAGIAAGADSNWPAPADTYHAAFSALGPGAAYSWTYATQDYKLAARAAVWSSNGDPVVGAKVRNLVIDVLALTPAA